MWDKLLKLRGRADVRSLMLPIMLCSVLTLLSFALSAPVPMRADRQSAAAVVIDVAGQVTARPFTPAAIRLAGNEKERLLTVGDTVPPGWVAETGADAKLELEVPGPARVLLDPLTAVVIQPENQLKHGDGTSVRPALRVNLGTVIVHLLKNAARLMEFYIETPTAVAGVRGTIFAVEVSAEAKTRVSVWEGRVAVQSLTAPAQVASQTVLLAHGEAAVVDTDESPPAVVRQADEFNQLWEPRRYWLDEQQRWEEEVHSAEDEMADATEDDEPERQPQTELHGDNDADQAKYEQDEQNPRKPEQNKAENHGERRTHGNPSDQGSASAPSDDENQNDRRSHGRPSDVDDKTDSADKEKPDSQSNRRHHGNPNSQGNLSKQNDKESQSDRRSHGRPSNLVDKVNRDEQANPHDHNLSVTASQIAQWLKMSTPNERLVLFQPEEYVEQYAPEEQDRRRSPSGRPSPKKNE